MVKGFIYLDTARFIHDCSKCKFLFSIAIHLEDNTFRYADVYENCSSILPEMTSIIIRYSSEGSDYTTTGLKTLCSHFVSDIFSLNKK